MLKESYIFSPSKKIFMRFHPYPTSIHIGQLYGTMRIFGVILVVLCPLCAYSECQSIANTGLFELQIPLKQSWAQFTKNFTTNDMRAGRSWCVRKKKSTWSIGADVHMWVLVAINIYLTLWYLFFIYWW